MAGVAKMVNPTPFEVKIPYSRGIYIKIPSDGETELSMEQLDDFRGGKPGSEETRKILQFEGVFLQDTDLSYDYQALQTLRAAVREREDRIKTFIDRTRNSRIAGGATVDDSTMEDLIQSAGYGRMQDDVNKLKARITTLSQVVNEDEAKGSVRQTLDPKRTCFVINPPRQFPSETALAMFLAENPTIKAEHDALTAPLTVEEVVATDPATVTVASEDTGFATPVHVPGPVGGAPTPPQEGEFNG